MKIRIFSTHKWLLTAQYTIFRLFLRHAFQFQTIYRASSETAAKRMVPHVKSVDSWLREEPDSAVGNALAGMPRSNALPLTLPLTKRPKVQ